jgi:hypothetical protein
MLSHPALAAALGFLIAHAPCLAQAQFAEPFDDNGDTPNCQKGPSNLIAGGWLFKDESQNGNCKAWADGDQSFFPPQAGPGFLGARPMPGYPYQVAIWAILPEIPGQQAGDTLAFWLRSTAQYYPVTAHLEVRYSPSGGTDTGTGPAHIGDFTEALLFEGGNYMPEAWTPYEVVVPGDGRLAFRIFGGHTDEDFQIGIDSLTVGSPPACPTFPPVPDPGQSVTWTLAGSPYQICAEMVIPETSKVVVEPGVTVNIDPDREILVEGILEAQGTANKPVTFNGKVAYQDFAWINVRGRAEFNHAVINAPIVWPAPRKGTTVIIRDSAIMAAQSGALGLTSPYITTLPPTVIVERTEVLGNGDPVDTAYRFYMPLCHSRLVDVRVEGCSTIFDGYAFLDGVTSVGAPQSGIFANEHVRNQYLNNVTVIDAEEAALALGPTRNIFLGKNNTLEGCLYPVAVNSLLPGSTVPASGNTFNHILAEGGTQLESDRLWTDAGVPWGWNAPNYGVGSTTMFPGITVLMYPDMFMVNQGGHIRALGEPAAPVHFKRQDPTKAWLSINEYVPEGSRYDHCILEGAADAAIVAIQGLVHADSSLIQGNAIGLAAGTNGSFKVRKTRFTGNQVAVRGNSYICTILLSTPDAPNSIAGNGVGVYVPGLEQFLPFYDARHVWWGHPTGPTVPENPGGQGDSIAGDYNNLHTGIVEFLPFLTEAPDFDNHPPVVRIPQYPGLFETGSKVILRWAAADDDQIVSQRILFSEWTNFDSQFEVIADNLDPGQRSYELTVPDVPLLHDACWFRIEAVDSRGQIGWDQFPAFIPSGDLDVDLTITSDYGGMTIRGGEDLPQLTWTPVHEPFGAGATFSIRLDADEQVIGLGGWQADEGYWNLTTTPFASTDLARIAITVYEDGTSSETFFGEYFSIRPDPQLGDEPPSVMLLTPQGGSFAGGGVVPISWSASDDESVRSFQIQATFDKGRSWHTIVYDLPGASTAFDWLLPPSGGIEDVRVRVIVRDLRFQNSSSTSKPFDILPGEGCYADLDGSGTLDLFDFLAFVNLYNAADPAADCTGDGAHDLFDFLCFVNAFNAGC